MTAALLLLACASPDPRPPCRANPDASPIVAATSADDYSAGALAAVSSTEVCDVGSLHGDAVVSVVDGAVYGINRLGSDAVRRYDVISEAPTWEIGTGRASNPQAVAGADGWIAISRLAASELLVVDAEDGAERPAIDLSPWADADGVPEQQGAAVDAGRLLVALQRLDRDDGFAPDPTGYVLGIDPIEGEVAFEVAVGPNPMLVAHPGGGAVVVADDGGWWRIFGDGRVEGPVPAGLDGVVSALSIAEDGRVVVVTRECALECPDHTVVCRSAWDGEVTGQTDPWPVFVPDLVVHDETIWLAARRSWADPEGMAGGIVPLPLDGCGPVPEPETWLRGTFAPYALAVR